MKTRFRKEADSTFIEAKRAMTATVTQIPWWFIGLTIALGWNELMAILRSPLFFLSLAMIVGTAYLIYSLGLSKAVLSISYSTVQTAFDELKIYLKTKGFNIDEILDGSMFNRWILIGQELFTTTLPNPVIEMQDMNASQPPVEKEKEK
jgi:hypothetical protein